MHRYILTADLCHSDMVLQLHIYNHELDWTSALDYIVDWTDGFVPQITFTFAP